MYFYENRIDQNVYLFVAETNQMFTFFLFSFFSSSLQSECQQKCVCAEANMRRANFKRNDARAVHDGQTKSIARSGAIQLSLKGIRLENRMKVFAQTWAVLLSALMELHRRCRKTALKKNVYASPVLAVVVSHKNFEFDFFCCHWRANERGENRIARNDLNARA